MPALSIHSLTKKYDSHPRVVAISFDVPRGVICGFVGPNGSGKTTTMRMLLGLVKPSSGSAEILGCPLTEPSSYLAKVGAMIEGPAFYPKLSAHKNLQYLQRVSGARVDHGSIEEALARVGLAGRGQENYRGFSLGMKQRLGIAAALMSAPELLILDEPTNGLDPVGAREIRELIIELAQQGFTIFISSHLLEELELMCDYFVMIDAGRIAFVGSARTLRSTQEQTLVVQPEYDVDLSLLVHLALNQGYLTRVESEYLQIFQSRDQGAEFNRLASEAGITLKHLRITTPSLAQIFFKAQRE